jgi:hypothetical protein
MLSSPQCQTSASSSLGPLARARQVYELEWCRNSFEEDLCWHLEQGYVFSTPTVFLMGYRDNLCWVVSLCSGDLLEALELMPYPLPWVAFERRNLLKVIDREKLYAKIAVLHRQRNPLLQGGS